MPDLSLIICSRNDGYMGNSLWRLQTVINLTALNVKRAGSQLDVEIIVVDWGSTTPLRESLRLSDTASGMTRFIEVPSAIVGQVEGDSKFAEVLALNVAVRKSRGLFVGRIDNDTIVGKNFVADFGDLLAGRSELREDPTKCVMFVRRRSVAYRFASVSPSVRAVDALIRWFGHWLPVERLFPFYRSPVGIFLMSRELWDQCRGYDEHLLYWGWMEADLALRANMNSGVTVLDLGDMWGVDLYHLEHYDPSTPRQTPRKVNPEVRPVAICPNADDWGLMRFADEMSERCGPSRGVQVGSSVLDVVRAISALRRCASSRDFWRPLRTRGFGRHIRRESRRTAAAAN